MAKNLDKRLLEKVNELGEAQANKYLKSYVDNLKQGVHRTELLDAAMSFKTYAQVFKSEANKLGE